MYASISSSGGPGGGGGVDRVDGVLCIVFLCVRVSMQIIDMRGLISFKVGTR